MGEEKFEFVNPRHNPNVLATPHLVLREQNLSLTEHCYLFNFMICTSSIEYYAIF